MAIEISSRKELFNLLDGINSSKPKSINQKICPNCGQKIYRKFIKGVEYWFGCACNKMKAHHYIK